MTKNQKSKSVNPFLSTRKKSNRKGIFNPYNPKTKQTFTIPSHDFDDNRHFPIQKPAHPKSLVHYIDISQHRKNKMFAKNQN